MSGFNVEEAEIHHMLPLGAWNTLIHSILSPTKEVIMKEGQALGLSETVLVACSLAEPGGCAEELPGCEGLA